jgi:RimJ/RimL family protein N-acetyltransferase/uncharacterized protein YbdZ (MbtH family)
MTHSVIINDEDQYAVWLLGTELPLGWHRTEWTGDEAACLDRIAGEWADLRPRSVRAAAASDAERPPVLLLGTDRLWLREVLGMEAEDIAKGDRAGLDWLGDGPSEGSREAAGLLVRACADGSHRPGWGMYLLVRSSDGVVVGGMGFHGTPDDQGQVEIGFDLAPQARGNGYASEALVGLARWGLQQPGVEQVIATTTPDNVPAQHVMERAGFRRLEDRGGLFVYELTS